ncbi:MAG: signal peptidase II [Opitutae bacterium]|nr:signal peptidase II [Opitutae bacterium]
MGNPIGNLALFTRILSYRWFYLVVFATVMLDRLTKWIIQLTLPFGSYEKLNMIEVIPGFFYLCHIGNTGAAWGIFPGRSFALAVFAISALGFIFVFRRALGLRNLNFQISWGILTGGIIGNLIDRLALGHVVDFIDLHLGFYRWPAFNIADMAILTGVCIFTLSSIRNTSTGTEP